MRRLLVNWLNGFPSDGFSFIAGAVFSAAINLATSLIDPKLFSKVHILLITGAFALSTLGFVAVGYIVKAAEGDAVLRDDPRQAKLVYINNRFWKLAIILLVIAILPLVLVLYDLLA